MKTFTSFALLIFSTCSIALSPWLENLDSQTKQQQLDLRWKAYGGQADLKFMYKKLNSLNVQVFPKPEFPTKHWDFNHLVFPISEKSNLEIQMPYGNIEKVTSGSLLINSDFTFTNGKNTLKVSSFRLVPIEKPSNNSDIVTFKFIDQNNRHLFTINSVHIQYDKDKKLLLMSNMDLFATKKIAALLNTPNLENQVVGQLHTYNKLNIPKNAQSNAKGASCSDHPVWPPTGDVDVSLIDIATVQWMRNIGSDKIVIAPSARLKNVGTADVPWYQQFTLPPHAPYNNDQHPFLNWSIYREIDGRFEQLGVSGVKHAFLTINSNCTINCGDNHILWLGCEDVYGIGNNDSSFALGPRSEIEANTGFWDNCGSFFDPKPCTGSHQNSSNGTDENRLTLLNSKLSDMNNTAVYMQAWYLIRDDVNIFNTMGYRSINPVNNGSNWSMSPLGTFNNGPALDTYVTPNTITTSESSQTQTTVNGQYTVAVKVVDLGNDLYRYNYAIENYSFDPRFEQFSIPLFDSSLITNMIFSDSDDDLLNDWTFNFSNNQLQVVGNNANEQDWGMLFSFSFTAPAAPKLGEITIKVAEPALVSTVSSPVLTPDLNNFNVFFKSSFED